LISIIDQSTIYNFEKLDNINTYINGVYEDSFLIYLDLKHELTKYIDYELLKKEAAQEFYNFPLNKTVYFDGNYYNSANDLFKGKYYQMNIPQDIITPKIGTSLMPLINTDLTTASESILNLNNLYNVNACKTLYDSVEQREKLNRCNNFWSSILLKGMGQSITQMSDSITSVLDEFKSLKLNTKNLTEIISENSIFHSYEIFIHVYLLDSYTYTVKIFNELNLSKLKQIHRLYNYIMIGYIIFGVFLTILLLYFIYNSKKILNTFMNFIGILPMIYIIEDNSFFKKILKLEKYI